MASTLRCALQLGDSLLWLDLRTSAGLVGMEPDDGEFHSSHNRQPIRSHDVADNSFVRLFGGRTTPGKGIVLSKQNPWRVGNLQTCKLRPVATVRWDWRFVVWEKGTSSVWKGEMATIGLGTGNKVNWSLRFSRVGSLMFWSDGPGGLWWDLENQVWCELEEVHALPPSEQPAGRKPAAWQSLLIPEPNPIETGGESVSGRVPRTAGT